MVKKISNKIYLEINVKEIIPNKNQPREIFDEDKIIELAESINKNGLIQPIIVREKNEKYELIAGERRLRAFKLLGIEKIPAIIKDIDEKESSKLALIENIQRENLSPIEEAYAYRNILDGYGMTQKELAESIGKSRPYISNSIRLLDLDEEIIELINEEDISVGHGKTLLAIKDKKEQIRLAKQIIEDNLSVRKLEEIIKKEEKSLKKSEKKVKKKDNYILELENELMMSLGTKVNLKLGKNKGIIEIEYYNEEDLSRIIELLR